MSPPGKRRDQEMTDALGLSGLGMRVSAEGLGFRALDGPGNDGCLIEPTVRSVGWVLGVYESSAGSAL